MLNNSSILITGGTGCFGNTFVPMTLAKYTPKRLVICSRGEMKQWKVAQKFKGESRVRSFIGQVRDKNRLARAFDGIDFVVPASVTKIAPTAIHGWSTNPARFDVEVKVKSYFTYTSAKSAAWMSVEQQRARIDANRSMVGTI